ncbi:hypothetical protein HC023_01340 [Streptomyces sp. NEAU-H3]|nr:hypothetical protein [Streptomyces sp. NEAU-H3]
MMIPRARPSGVPEVLWVYDTFMLPHVEFTPLPSWESHVHVVFFLPHLMAGLLSAH